MPNFSSGLSIEESTVLLGAIVEALIPLCIWLFWDLEQRRQRWLAMHDRPQPVRGKA